MQNASIGSISSGTLRTPDLLESFANELDYHVQRNAAGWSSDDGRATRNKFIQLVWLAREFAEDDGETGTSLVDELIDALTAFAPAYCYFGANEGDGACFGFWPCMDSIDELPRVNDPAEVDGFGEDCVFVNDHGNVTVYASDGSVIFDCV